MKKEDVLPFLNKKVHLVTLFGDNPNPIFFMGLVLKVNEDSVVMRDKFNLLVTVSIDSIKKIEEIEGWK
jgi:hypothetical protein